MKQISEKAVCIYTDEMHEAQTRIGLRDAQRALQKLVNAWNELGLGPCENVNSLVMRPEKAYQDAIDKMVQVPVTPGPFRLKKADYVAGLDLPDISQLLAARKEAINMPFCASPAELWSVDIDGKVILDEKEATLLVTAKSIFAHTSEQINLCRNLQKWCDLTNKLNKETKGEILNYPQNIFTQNKFKIHQKTVNDLYEISLDPYFLNKLLNQL